MMHRKILVDTLVLIPTFKIYMFLYSRQTDRQTDGEINLVWAGYCNLIGSSRVSSSWLPKHPYLIKYFILN
jgi:hypothetical protein